MLWTLRASKGGLGLVGSLSCNLVDVLEPASNAKLRERLSLSKRKVKRISERVDARSARSREVFVD